MSTVFCSTHRSPLIPDDDRLAHVRLVHEGGALTNEASLELPVAKNRH